MTRTVWIVNHYAHHRDRDGRATRHQHFAEHLTAHGWYTVVVAADTDHPTGRSHLRGARLRDHLHGDGHEFWWLRGVDHRGAGVRRTIRRAADVLSFTTLLLVPAMLRRLPPPDVVVGGSFHPLAAWAASVLARRNGVPFVFEPRDLWPESAIGIAGLTERHPAIRALRRLERTIVGRAAHIVSPLDGVGRYYAARGYRGPFTCVPNGVLPDAGEPTPDPTVPPAERGTGAFTIAYIGSMGPANALDAVLDGFDRAVRRADAAGGPRLELSMVGDGSDASRLRERASSLPSGDRIRWVGRVPQDDARRIGRQADCLVLTMLDLPLYRHGVSLNKQFEYMLLGRPLLVSAPVPLPPVRDADCGVQVAPGAEALAQGMLRLARMSEDERDAMGARGHRYVLEHHDYRVLTARFAGVLDEVVA